jgi:hypothetical protein
VAADVGVWVALGLLLALLGARAWVVETGHAVLGRTPVKVKVLTAACALAAAVVVGAATFDGGAQLVSLLLDPAKAEALQEAHDQQEPAPAQPGVTQPGPAQPAPAAPGPARPAAPGPVG